jgi:hypothetical protein
MSECTISSCTGQKWILVAMDYNSLLLINAWFQKSLRGKITWVFEKPVESVSILEADVQNTDAMENGYNAVW